MAVFMLFRQQVSDMVGIESKYGFPLFTKDHSTEYLVKNERLRVSDIWAFWNYIITASPLRIRTESIIYNLMFFFGSITRYYPFLFDSLLSEKELWIISEFLNTQPMQFLHLVTSKVIGGKILKPRTMNIV